MMPTGGKTAGDKKSFRGGVESLKGIEGIQIDGREKEITAREEERERVSLNIPS